MPGGKGGAQRIEPFNKENVGQVINPLRDAIMGGFGGWQMGDAQKAINIPHQLEASAMNILQGPMGPQSFIQGGQGSLGTAGGLFGQAQGAVGSDPYGAKPAFTNFLSSGFTDVQNDPQTQALLRAQETGVQSLLNRNLGDIAATSQRASGGLGTGSGETAAKTRAVTQAAGQLANQQAQTLFGEQARRQGVQLAAAQQAMGEGNRQAQILGSLGSGLGQLGLGRAGLGSQMLGQMIGLGGTMQGRNVASQLFPMEQVFRLGELLKSASGVRTPGFLEQLGSLGSAAGGVALGGEAAGLWGK